LTDGDHVADEELLIHSIVSDCSVLSESGRSSGRIGMLRRAAVGKIRRDPSRPETVITVRRGYPGRLGTSDRGVRIGLTTPLFRKSSGGEG
jgi:hypothetical protein